jgi:hypothetical protein
MRGRGDDIMSSPDMQGGVDGGENMHAGSRGIEGHDMH